MKAITILPPFARWIAEGRKTLEIRSWHTGYRGDLLVAVGQRIFNGYCWLDGARFDCVEIVGDWVRQGEKLYMGKAICVVSLVDCYPMLPGLEDHACIKKSTGWAWVLENPRPVEPVEVRGIPGIFDVPDELIQFTSRPEAAQNQ